MYIYSLRITCVVLHRKHFQIEYLKWSLGCFFFCVRSQMCDGPKTVTITANQTQIRRPAAERRTVILALAVDFFYEYPQLYKVSAILVAFILLLGLAS